MLQITELTCRIGGRAILDRASAQIPTGAKVGLVGRNGAGKTTLLRLIAGTLQPDEGGIQMPSRARLGVMAQNPPSGDETAVDAVLAADSERSALLAEAETATDPDRIAAIHARLGDIGAEAAPSRAAAILAGLGFDPAMQATPCGALSGGWRMRVALAAVLFVQADILLLDEPSNHLDLESALWLEGFLKRVRGTLVLVSHDRDLLDRVTDRTLHLDAGKLTLYAGGFSAFERTLRERREQLRRAAASQADRRARMEAFVARFRAKATKARQAQSRLKALERMAPVEPVLDPVAAAAIDFPDPGPLAPPIVVLDKATVGYADNPPVLSNVELRIDMDDRIALIGRNGNGKTTLARLIAGRLDARSGEVRRHRGLRVGYFAQDQADELDRSDTAFHQLARLEPTLPAERVRAHLGRFGFSGNKADVTVGQLSGGEMARLMLALVSRKAPHLLVLDEPTNHLDIETRDAFAEAVAAFPGAVVLITHDAHLIELCAERLYLVSGGRCMPFDGDIADYRERVLAEERAARARPADGAPPAPHSAAARREARRTAAGTRAALTGLRQAARKAEARLETLSHERADIEALLADPGLYQGPPAKLQDLLKRQGELARQIETAEADWLDAHEALEQAAQG